MSRYVVPPFSKLLHSPMIFSTSIPHLCETGKKEPGVIIRNFMFLIDLCEG